MTPYKDIAVRLAEDGIHITTLAELMERDPYHQHKLYQLDGETSEDTRQHLEITRPHFDHYVATVFQFPGFMPEATFIAVKQGEYIGVSSLESRGKDDELIVGYTGVLKPFRRQGIALALKMRTIVFAQRQKNATIVTWNNSNNRPVLALNERLGFVRQPAWISFRKEIETK